MPHAHNRVDPTETKTLRMQYGRQLSKRYRRIKGAVWQGIGIEDRLGLREGDGPSEAILPPEREAIQQDTPFPDPEESPDPEEMPNPIRVDPGPGLRPTDDPRAIGPDVRDYIEWFSETQQEVVIGPEGPGGRTWSEKYIRYAYEKGVEDADRRAIQSGADLPDDIGLSLDLPIHRRTIRILLHKNRAGLDGVAEATTREVSRILVDAVLQGANPREAARAINDAIDTIGIERARTHARTSIVGSYNESTLRRYEQLLGEDAEVAVLAEFRTAGDDRVCEICAGMEGRTFSVREARGVIPQHPNCRCTWVPVFPEEQETPSILNTARPAA